MLTKLEQRVDQLGELHTKLLILTGSRGSGKTKLLQELGAQLGVQPVNVNLALGRRLAATPHADCGFAAGQLLRELADKQCMEQVLLLDNIEVLFAPCLELNPLELLKRLAHAKRVVAVWPGELRGKRLSYAEPSHAEYRDYDASGVVAFEI